jgi:hypothetical protein
MKRLIIFICCTLCIPTAAIAGVLNIKHMNRNSNDNFDVTCLNGALETVNSKTILDNSVCKTATDKPFSASPSVACTGDELTNRFHITKISNGKKLGDSGASLSFKVCQQAVGASNSEVVCTGNEVMDWFHITRISDGEKLGHFGEKLPFKVCQQAVRASVSAFVCTGSEFMDWFHITRISDGKKLCERLSFQNCLQLISGSE